MDNLCKTINQTQTERQKGRATHNSSPISAIDATSIPIVPSAGAGKKSENPPQRCLDGGTPSRRAGRNKRDVGVYIMGRPNEMRPTASAFWRWNGRNLVRMSAQRHSGRGWDVSECQEMSGMPGTRARRKPEMSWGCRNCMALLLDSAQPAAFVGVSARASQGRLAHNGLRSIRPCG